MPLLTAESRDALKQYKYKGEDRSLLYKYFLSPLAESLVQQTPVWLAYVDTHTNAHVIQCTLLTPRAHTPAPPPLPPPCSSAAAPTPYRCWALQPSS